MRISTKGRYGLRVMIELAAHFGRGPAPVEAIAKNQDISGKYIHVIVTRLRSAGLVRAVRGPNGGYELTRHPASITVLDVVSALEGKLVPVECLLDRNACPRFDKCAAREIWSEMASAVEGVMSALTLEQLSARQKAKNEEQPNYFI